VNDYLDFGTDNILAGKSQFTVEMRMHFDNIGGDYTIIGQRNSDANRTIVLQRWAGAFHLFLSNASYGYCSFIPCQADLYHIAIVYDGSALTSSGRLKLYINGTSQTLTFFGNIFSVSHVTSPAANLVLGCEYNGPASQLQYVNGQFGEFCIWNYPLTAAEISSRITQEVLGTETGLVEYFHFDNGIPGGNNTGITSFTGGKSLSTITPKNMTLNGTSSNFTGLPTFSNVINTTVTLANPVITSNEPIASYQWLDCNNGFAIIPGATSQSYTATATGSYAVKITQGACVDTSVCTAITTLGVGEIQQGSISVFPNPVMNELSIVNDKIGGSIYFEILNVTGQVVSTGTLSEKAIVKTADWSPGIYVIKFKSENLVELRTIVKN
jgi:hypothetical protein